MFPDDDSPAADPQPALPAAPEQPPSRGTGVFLPRTGSTRMERAERAKTHAQAERAALRAAREASVATAQQLQAQLHAAQLQQAQQQQQQQAARLQQAQQQQQAAQLQQARLQQAAQLQQVPLLLQRQQQQQAQQLLPQQQDAAAATANELVPWLSAASTSAAAGSCPGLLQHAGPLLRTCSLGAASTASPLGCSPPAAPLGGSPTQGSSLPCELDSWGAPPCSALGSASASVDTAWLPRAAGLPAAAAQRPCHQPLCAAPAAHGCAPTAPGAHPVRPPGAPVLHELPASCCGMSGSFSSVSCTAASHAMALIDEPPCSWPVASAAPAAVLTPVTSLEPCWEPLPQHLQRQHHTSPQQLFGHELMLQVAQLELQRRQQEQQRRSMDAASASAAQLQLQLIDREVSQLLALRHAVTSGPPAAGGAAPAAPPTLAPALTSAALTPATAPARGPPLAPGPSAAPAQPAPGPAVLAALTAGTAPMVVPPPRELAGAAHGAGDALLVHCMGNPPSALSTENLEQLLLSKHCAVASSRTWESSSGPRAQQHLAARGLPGLLPRADAEVLDGEWAPLLQQARGTQAVQQQQQPLLLPLGSLALRPGDAAAAAIAPLPPLPTLAPQLQWLQQQAQQP